MNVEEVKRYWDEHTTSYVFLYTNKDGEKKHLCFQEKTSGRRWPMRIQSVCDAFCRKLETHGGRTIIYAVFDGICTIQELEDYIATNPLPDIPLRVLVIAGYRFPCNF